MTRFDPTLYPGRFVFEARAKELRTEELARLRRVLATWLGNRLRALGEWAHLGHLHTRQPHAH